MQEDFTADDRHRAAKLALARLVEGAISPALGQIVPPQHAADAHTATAERHVVGETLLTP